MTVSVLPPAIIPLLPQTAPFSAEQRAWLNGFFAGLMAPSDLAETAVPVTAPVEALQQALHLEPETGADDAPWHDPILPIEERLQLAEGRSFQQRLMAAMAQQDCGQCGYVCETYAAAIADGAETRLNLCVPGEKPTLRALKALVEATASPVGPVSSLVKPLPAPVPRLDHDDFGLNQSKIMNVIDSNKLERDAQISLRNPRKLDCAGKPVPTFPHPALATDSKPRGYSREAPVDVTFLSRRKLNMEGSEKASYHIEFDLAESSLDYVVGDSFGVYPQNDPALVDAILATISAPEDFPIMDRSLREVLLNDVSLGAAPDALFELVSYITGGERKQKAKRLARGEDPDGDAATLDVLAIFEKFAGIHPDPEALVECLEPLQPRLYSISSSHAKCPGRLSLTVDHVRYEIGDRLREGAASSWLATRLEPGTRLKAYVQKAHNFALPASGDTPIIMIGPGTGVAPFRAFLQEREVRAAKGGAWLFFGHQRQATDFFYEDEMDAFLNAGVLTNLSLAWSRDGARKIYVQDKLREAGKEVWDWIARGAHIYVCGDALRMAGAVEKALADIVAEHSRRDAEQARHFVQDLKKGGAYQTDVY
ncbi:MAG: sulfite reductase subunit alpha [Beijerinckiaceae bacterium]